MENITFEEKVMRQIVRTEKTEYGDRYGYDAHGNLIRLKVKTRIREATIEYDQYGNQIHSKDSKGREYWTEYDEHGNMIHRKDSNGFEEWWETDELGRTVYRDSTGYKKTYPKNH